MTKDEKYFTVRITGELYKELENKLKALKRLPVLPEDKRRITRNGLIVKAIKHYLAQLDV